MRQIPLLILFLLVVIFQSCSENELRFPNDDFKRVVLDTNPPSIPLSPEESIAKIQLPPGYRIELVASEPMVQEPVAIAWDGNGRMFVAEMNTYMKDVNATGQYEPVSRIKLLEDLDGDGTMDKSTIYAEGLLLPRSILAVGDRLLVQMTDTQHIWSFRDTNGDGKADEKKIAFHNQVLDVRNLEHQNGGLIWNLDNWIYPTRDNLRYRFSDGKLSADTMQDNMIGQWGITTNDYGRLFYSEAGPGLPAVQIQQMPAYGALNFRDQYSPDFTLVWPIIGNLDAQGGRKALREKDNTLEKFTSGCGQSIFRGDRLPQDMRGDYFIPEPVARIIKRGKVISRNGRVYIESVYKEQEWLASADMNFRPINTYTGPDGCFYIVDMYHGIIQESEWTEPGSYLRSIIEQKELYKNRGMGRIYRVVHKDHKRDATKPSLLSMSSKELVKLLDHPNGWWRDNAQIQLIVNNDSTIVPVLNEIVMGSNNTVKNGAGTLGRIHALWTLEGMKKIDRSLLIKAFTHKDPQVRKTAIWISEQFLKQNDTVIMKHLGRLEKDENAEVLVQLSLSLRLSTNEESRSMLRRLLAANPGNELMQYSYTTFVEARKMRIAERERTMNLSPEHRKLVTNGATIYKQLCASCHGVDGKGVRVGNNEVPAPPIVGSPRVRGDKILITQLLLNGLKGPVDGKSYPDIMPSMDGNDDEWLASVLSYIRNSAELGNNSSVVTPAEVKEIRSNTPKIPGGMTMQQLEIFKLGRAERTNWKKEEQK